MAKQSKEQRPQKLAALKTEERPNSDVPPPRMSKVYSDEIVPALKQEFGYTNIHAIPKIEKIVISMGLGKAVVAGEKQRMDVAERELTMIAGQKPVRTKAKKSVAGFKVREGQETGLMVTLRGARMWEFFDRLVNLAIPRVKDFRGLNPKSFDGQGNYNFGLNEQVVFPEIDSASAVYQQGMNITITTTAATADEGRALLKGFSFPFRKDEEQKQAA